MPSKPISIAIVGAGPSGAALARLLQVLPPKHQHSIQVTVFERETQLHDRDQGGTLDLHDETGIAALKLAGLADLPAFTSMARWDGDAMVLCDKDMQRWLSLESTKYGSWLAQGKPEDDRLQLRQLLIDSLAKGTVVWGKHISRVEHAAEGAFVLHFQDGTSQGPPTLSTRLWARV